jgi:hypothetical protein|tara:strand:- start:203 stop:460 length:258 start_codon:yes stop_codon:yes gene_type:complete
MMNEVQKRYKKSLEMLAEIMEPMSDIAMAQSQFRCPYKNKNDRCTAKFGCRNQRKQEAGDLMLCVADDKLDYRPFWETEIANIER